MGGKGLFTKELEQALFAGEIDLIVHSMKDVPMQVDGLIPLVGVTAREDPRDALVLPAGASRMDAGRPVGCSSRRRAIQLLALHPEWTVESVRGNVQTRLRKLDEGQFGALVLAAAGLKRLGLEARVSACFSPEEMLPAACQGILALQARADFDRSLLSGAADGETWQIAAAERSFVRALDGGCTSPVAAHAVVTGGVMTLTGLYVENDDQTTHRDSISGPPESGAQMGLELAQAMKERWGGR